MDSRDVKTPTPIVENGAYLEKMYELQKELLNHYIKIEGIPEYPLDVNSKKNQVILKDFTGRVIEELGEGYESMLNVYVNRLNIIQEDNKDGDYYKVGVADIQNMNEEFADALHFILELMIYANIQPEDIYQYMIKQAKELNDNTVISVKNLDDLMIIGRKYINSTPLDSRNIVDIPKVDDECTPVGWRTGYSFINSASVMLWDITYSLSISRNCLKNKPWKQSGELTDENLYQKLLCESFVKLMGFYENIGYLDKSLFTVYFKKNCINQFRIKSKY